MAITRDMAERPKLTWAQTQSWIHAQQPNTLMLFENDEPLTMTEKYFTKILNRHDRRGGVVTYLEAVELRICAWPKPGEPQALLERRNLAAMATLDLAFRVYSP